jgi:FtsZ-interacting cell division protein ZipA
MPFKKTIIITLLVIGFVSIIAILLTNQKRKTKKKENSNTLKYSKKTNENFREIELSHGNPDIFINKEKGFSQWSTNDIFKGIILRDQETDNIYTICKIKLSSQQILTIKNDKIDYDPVKEELHIKGNSISENTKTLYNILSTILNKDNNIYDLITEINENNKNIIIDNTTEINNDF